MRIVQVVVIVLAMLLLALPVVAQDVTPETTPETTPVVTVAPTTAPTIVPVDPGNGGGDDRVIVIDPTEDNAGAVIGTLERIGLVGLLVVSYWLMYQSVPKGFYEKQQAEIDRARDEARQTKAIFDDILVELRQTALTLARLRFPSDGSEGGATTPGTAPFRPGSQKSFERPDAE
jgi:hypothetical protein